MKFKKWLAPGIVFGASLSIGAYLMYTSWGVYLSIANRMYPMTLKSALLLQIPMLLPAVALLLIIIFGLRWIIDDLIDYFSFVELITAIPKIFVCGVAIYAFIFLFLLIPDI